MEVHFHPGDSVRVTSGPLDDFVGEVVDVNAEARVVKVVVEISERRIPVELGFDLVEHLDHRGGIGGAGVREPRRPSPESPEGTTAIDPQA